MSEGEKRVLGLEDMAKYVNEDLVKTIHGVCGEIEHSCSTVEFSIATCLAQSIGHSCDTVEELQDNIHAYFMFIQSIAFGQFMAEHGGMDNCVMVPVGQPSDKPN